MTYAFFRQHVFKFSSGRYTYRHNDLGNWLNPFFFTVNFDDHRIFFYFFNPGSQHQFNPGCPKALVQHEAVRSQCQNG